MRLRRALRSSPAPGTQGSLRRLPLSLSLIYFFSSLWVNWLLAGSWHQQNSTVGLHLSGPVRGAEIAILTKISLTLLKQLINECLPPVSAACGPADINNPICQRSESSLVYNEPIKSHEAENLVAKGELADILDGTWKDARKRHREPEELKLKKIVTVMKSFGFAVAIDTPWPFHSESAAESTHYSGTPEAGEHSPNKINGEEVSGQLCRTVEEYFMGERSTWKADKTLPVSAPESCDVWSGRVGVVI
ncbi:hypothetical protein G5714_011964 [Onychostoma macrolepis]|uniref:Uncharacterized protein n=1 Tax=Onychostoma macrolepis TaxID=369639 RepID=A0A7J6CK28_9TELE|nr:hypothetical protein G5714_011964 [Onychostoma macrolepis]